MAKERNTRGIESALKDLLFELSETDQSKFCIAVCDDLALREKIKTLIQDELGSQSIETLDFRLSAEDKDLTEILRHRVDRTKKQVVLIDGLEETPEDSLSVVFSYLNFKRDILSAQRLPILMFVSNGILNQLVARAPDFWSRRTVTHFFTPASVTELLAKLFATEEKSRREVPVQGKVFRALRKVFAHERELEQILQHSNDIAPLEIDRLASEIHIGINDLLQECYRSNSFEVAFRLWVLAGTDAWLRRMRRNVSDHFDPGFRDLYDDRMDIMLAIMKKIIPILENYNNNLTERVKERRKVNLLGYFNSYTEGEAWRMFKEIRVDNSMQEKVLPEQIVQLAAKDERLQASLLDDIQEKAADKLLGWIQQREGRLPPIFSKEDGKILRFLYRGKREPSSIGRALGITVEEAKKKIENVKSKVLLFVAVDPWI